MSHLQVDSLGQQKLYYIHLDIVDSVFTIEYTIYRLDLSQSGGNAVPIPSPVITLERKQYPSQMGFGALGSKIYMVGGSKRIDGVKYSKLEPSLDLYIFDTSSPVPSVTIGPPLNTPLLGGPVVIPHQGKLYVMPRLPKCRKGGDRSVIEVLDPIMDSWSVIEFPLEMWKMGLQCSHDPNCYQIACYAVSGSEILLTFKMSWLMECGIFVYNTETEKWVYRRASSQLISLPFSTGSCFMWDNDDIWCCTISLCGELSFHDNTLTECIYGDTDYEEHGEIQFSLSDLSCCHENPFEEDARVIELSPGFVVVVSRCWMKRTERLFEVRLHLLRLSFERSGESSKARVKECEVIKCVSFLRPVVCDDPEKSLTLYGIHQVTRLPMNYCFLI